jgi:hypothetical protein
MQAIKPTGPPQHRPRVGQYNDRAQTVAAILHASGHAPDVLAYCALRIIAKRCPDLSFDDFVSGAFLAHVMSEAASPDGGHA